jgi:hypothetical protein
MNTSPIKTPMKTYRYEELRRFMSDENVSKFRALAEDHYKEERAINQRALISDSMIRHECMKAQMPLERINQIVLEVNNEDRSMSLNAFCDKWVK